MRKAENTDPEDQIVEVWWDMFLAWPVPDMEDSPFTQRPQKEALIILKYMFGYFFCWSFDEFLKNKKKKKGWSEADCRVLRILQAAAEEIEAPRNQQAWVQIKNKVGELYATLSENGLDSKSQNEKIVRYLHSEPDLWARAQKVPSFRDIEDETEKELLSKLRALVKAWDAKP